MFLNKSKKLFILTDFYLFFYFNFIKDKKNPNSKFCSKTINTILGKAWADFAFQLICFNHIDQICDKIGVGGVIRNIYSWRSKDIDYHDRQIDLLIVRADQMLNSCEIKFSKNEFEITEDDDEKMNRKVWTLVDEITSIAGIHITFISTFGIKQNAYWMDIQSEVVLEDLFKF